MANNTKNFLVSTADFAFYHNGALVCTGTTNLNTSIEVSMQEQNINGGKGNKLAYTYKYGRELSGTLEAADWKLEYIRMCVGTPIEQKLTDVYKINECVDVINGIGTLSTTPVGDVAVELADGTVVMIANPGSTAIDLTSAGLSAASGTVKATYRYNTMAKVLTIDADSLPMIGTLILDADRHNNQIGKVGSLQIHIPSYQLDGNFNIEFTPEGVTSTSMNGKALAVGGDTCADGSDVYAYIKEFDTTEAALSVVDIAATPAKITLSKDAERTITVVGLKSAYYPIQLDPSKVTFASDKASIATVNNDGVVKGISAGTATITVTYGEYTDTVVITVIA